VSKEPYYMAKETYSYTKRGLLTLAYLRSAPEDSRRRSAPGLAVSPRASAMLRPAAAAPPTLRCGTISREIPEKFQRNSREIPEKFQDKMSIRKCQSSIPSRQSKIPSSQSNPFSQKFQDKSKMSVPENVVRRVRSGKGETERGYF
jgi:hypothetical protein